MEKAYPASSTGTVRFVGIYRCWDDSGRNAFEVSLPNRPPLFGEWDKKYAGDGTRFDIEIVCFGYSEPTNLANPHPKARELLSNVEICEAKNLITLLFSNPTETPFAKAKASYNGVLTFKRGWVR